MYLVFFLLQGFTNNGYCTHQLTNGLTHASLIPKQRNHLAVDRQLLLHCLPGWNKTRALSQIVTLAMTPRVEVNSSEMKCQTGPNDDLLPLQHSHYFSINAFPVVGQTPS